MPNENDQTDDTRDDETGRETLARRNLLRLSGIAAAGVAAGAIATAVSASPANAAAGDNMIIGDLNDAGSSRTYLQSTPAVDAVLTAYNKSSGIGLEGMSSSGIAIRASAGGSSPALDAANNNPTGNGSAIHAHVANGGNASNAVEAFTAGTGRAIAAHIDNESSTQGAIVAWTAGSGPAIAGLGNPVSDGAGVYGETGGIGPGVLGTALYSGTGPGVLGTGLGTGPGVRAVGRFIPASTGVGSGNAAALDVRGRAAFTRSGLLTIPAGANNAFTGLVAGGLFSSSRVLATIQENKGTVTVRAAVPITAGPNKGKIQIILTGAVPASPAGGLKVGWFVFG